MCVVVVVGVGIFGVCNDCIVIVVAAVVVVDGCVVVGCWLLCC